MTTPLDNSKAQTRETQTAITPEIAFQWLIQGNQRFSTGATFDRNYQEMVASTALGQFPFAVVLSCIDSRTPSEIIFDQGIGDLFNVRIAGNIVNDDILGSIEFACKVAGAKLIVVMGHSRCGAIRGACEGVKLGNLTGLLDKIQPAVRAAESEPGVAQDSSNSDFLEEVAIKNVEMSIEKIKHDSSVLKELHQRGDVNIVGAFYDVTTGVVKFLDHVG